MVVGCWLPPFVFVGVLLALGLCWCFGFLNVCWSSLSLGICCWCLEVLFRFFVGMFDFPIFLGDFLLRMFMQVEKLNGVRIPSF